MNDKALNSAFVNMKNSADLGGCYPPQPYNTLLDLQNSSCPTKVNFNNC